MTTPHQSRLKIARTIVVDWGTTSLRATLVDEAGTVEAARELERGIRFIEGRAFERTLLDVIHDWCRPAPLPIVALGMITSRNGWVEVPYVPCPVSIDSLARGATLMTLDNGSTLTLLPGITDRSRSPWPDVMRGEETQIIGFGLDEDATLVLPGTHSKWARLRNRGIDGFQTFVTGELFSLLADHSFVAGAADAQESMQLDAFESGVRHAMAARSDHGALMTLLFSARTGMLDGALGADTIRDYTSGLLIGHEFREARDCGWFKAGDRIGIIGNDGLKNRYRRAAALLGLDVTYGGTQAAVRGALAIASRIGVST